jgi:DNA-binding GntR family transcriptional regulator
MQESPDHRERSGKLEQFFDVSETIAERIEQAMRRDIVNGVLAPGSRLRISELSKNYGVSPIPVREALRQLEGDRLVVMESHKGAVLRDVNRKFVSDMYDLRGAVEALTVRRAAQNLTPQAFDELRNLADAYEVASDQGGQREMLLANQAFHNFIGTLADNPEANRLMMKGWELIIGIRGRFGFGGQRIKTIMGEHSRLVAAIGRREAELAVMIAQEHCEGAKQDLLGQMERAGNYT